MLYKLSDVFDLQMGKTPSRDNNMYWKDGNLPWVSIADLSKSQMYIENSKEMITNLAAKDTLMKCIPQDTVIMSFKLSLGKIAITKTPLYTNEAIMGFIDKKLIQIEPKYIYFLFRNIKWGQYTNNAVKGKTLNKKFFSDFQIYIPEYTQQTKIASILIRINKILEYKHSLIKAYDAIIKSRFVEMFGDIRERGRFKAKKWKDVLDIFNGKDYKAVQVDKGGYPVYGSGGIIARANDYICPAGTIIIGRKGSINNPILVNEKFWNVDTAFGIVPKEIINISYLYYFCKQYNFNYLNKATTLPSLTKRDLLEIEINIPDLEEQVKFSGFVNQINKLKADVQKSIDETQLLMDSLMQEYFG